jgi:hypothetical protein
VALLGVRLQREGALHPRAKAHCIGNTASSNTRTAECNFKGSDVLRMQVMGGVAGSEASYSKRSTSWNCGYRTCATCGFTGKTFNYLFQFVTFKS